MFAVQKLVRPMWHVAALASILGVLLGVMAVVTGLSMAVPIFTGQRTRDAMMIAFMCLPLMQVALVAVGTVREEGHPGMALRLYVLATALLAVLIAIPAVADLVR